MVIPHAASRLVRFLQAHSLRVAIGATLTVALYFALLIYLPFAREYKIATKIKTTCGTVRYVYVGPSWLPKSLQARSPFYRVKDVQIFTFNHLESELREPLAELKGLERLTELTLLDSIGFTGPEPIAPYPNNMDETLQQVQGLPHLKCLGLYSRQITDSGLQHLKDLPRLEELNLESLPIKDAGLEHLQHLTTVRRLNLAETKIFGRGLDHLSAFSKLETLSLASTEVNDASLQNLSGLWQLKSLSLRDTKIGDEGLKMLQQLAQLENLDLCHTQVTDSSAELLKAFKNLRNLRLEGTRISDEVRSQLRLDLPNCAITP